MKNKHLVLLFLLTLVIGLSIRQAPWRNATFFQTSLLKVDTAAIQQIKISLPSQQHLVFTRGDASWVAEQEDRSVNIPVEHARNLLQAIAGLRSIRIVNTSRPDTLGFSPKSAIQVDVLDRDNQAEQFWIGLEADENGAPANYVKMPKHEGIYLVNNHLRKLFSKTLRDFRDPGIASFKPENVRSLLIFGKQLDSLSAQKTPDTEAWSNSKTGQQYPNAQVEKWLAGISGLRNLVFADLFDESHAQQQFYAQIRLEFEGAPSALILNIYRIQRPNVPEELPENKLDRRQLSPYVLHSSQNPNNYFAISDTSILNPLCQPF